MKFEMVMPKMGESITEGTILRWFKKVGDMLEKDEIILEISTDKVDSEIPTPVAGKLVELLVPEGETVEVGVPIAVLEADKKMVKKAKAEQPDMVKTETGSAQPDEKESKSENQQPQKKSPQKHTGASTKQNRFYSPVVMNIAAENDIGSAELDQIEGSGLNGRLTKKDILKYIQEGHPQPENATATYPEPVSTDSGESIETLAMDNMRKTIARHMIQSKQTSAHVNLYTEVDMHTISQIRERNKAAFKKRHGFSLTYMPFIAEAVVKALKEFPMVNASIDKDQILLKKFYNLGIAVAVENGLLVPNIFRADEKSLTGMAKAINDLAVRAREKKLQPDELSNGTFSISNFGVYGTTVGFPIINQPQVAILGVGAVKKRPVVISDAIAIRPIMYLSLTIDHRLIDGAMGSQFLERIRGLLEAYDPHMTI